MTKIQLVALGRNTVNGDTVCIENTPLAAGVCDVVTSDYERCLDKLYECLTGKNADTLTYAVVTSLCEAAFGVIGLAHADPGDQTGQLEKAYKQADSLDAALRTLDPRHWNRAALERGLRANNARNFRGRWQRLVTFG